MHETSCLFKIEEETNEIVERNANKARNIIIAMQEMYHHFQSVALKTFALAVVLE